MAFGMEKLGWRGYPMVKKIKMCLFVSTEFTNVMDGWTDGHTPHDGIGCAAKMQRVVISLFHYILYFIFSTVYGK